MQRVLSLSGQGEAGSGTLGSACTVLYWHQTTNPGLCPCNFLRGLKAETSLVYLTSGGSLTPGLDHLCHVLAHARVFLVVKCCQRPLAVLALNMEVCRVALQL